MRTGLTGFVLATLAVATAPGPQGTPRDAPPRRQPEPLPATADPDVASLVRYEPTGLSLLQPYRRGRVPVVFVHGLWSGPWSWSPMVEALEADPALSDRYQFWAF